MEESQMDDPINSMPPHILVFPSPLESPLTAMFDLAELLCLSGLHVTFLLLPHTRSLLLRHFHLESRLNPYPNFRLHTISDGLPPDHSRSDPTELLDALQTLAKPIFRDLFTSGKLISDDRLPVSCIISDLFMTFVYDVADEIQIPVYSALALSPCSVWLLFNLTGAGEVSDSIEGNNNVDSLKSSVPGMSGILSRSDLASMCRSRDLGCSYWKHLMKQIKEVRRAHGLILNTFKALDGLILSRIRSICPNLYPIGPIHAHLGIRQEAKRMTPFLNYSVNENNNCVVWLDLQQPKSVLYVNVENQEQLTRVQTIELWHGLVNSGKMFLWVRKPEFVLGDDRLPPKILKGTKERGCIVDSASNVQVLAHKAIGAFLTRGERDSTLQGVVEGVPLICWPSSLDQQVNSKFVSKAWKIGIDMHVSLDKSVIEKTIRVVMRSNGDLIENANKMKNLGRKSVSKGGSSNAMLDQLVYEIRLMQPQVNGL